MKICLLKERLMILPILLCFVAGVSAAAYMVETVPNPKQEGQDRYVCNPDGVLRMETVGRLDEQCRRIDQTVETEVCVVAISQFDENRYDAYDFALRLFNTWGVGR